VAHKADVADARPKASAEPAVRQPQSRPVPVADPAPVYDLERLERAIRALVGEKRSLQGDNERLQLELAQRDDELRALNQRRQDAFKRIDDLIAQMDQLDSQLAAD